MWITIACLHFSFTNLFPSSFRMGPAEHCGQWQCDSNSEDTSNAPQILELQPSSASELVSLSNCASECEDFSSTRSKFIQEQKEAIKQSYAMLRLAMNEAVSAATNEGRVIIKSKHPGHETSPLFIIHLLMHTTHFMSLFLYFHLSLYTRYCLDIVMPIYKEHQKERLVAMDLLREKLRALNDSSVVRWAWLPVTQKC